MGQGMRIQKILNNNAAVVSDGTAEEKIVMGRGICFKKKVGEEVPAEVADKVFALSTADANTKFQVLIKDMPMEHIVLGERIIMEARERLGKKLNDMLYISLIDHVHTSIVRYLDGITVKNALLWEIRRFYREEYEIGLWALRQIAEEFKVRLPEDEAGFIALHIANAEMDEQKMHNMYEITRIMQEISNIVKYHFQMEFDEDDVYYYRFITHLKFFAKRLVEAKAYDDGDGDGLFEMIRGRYADAYGCVEKITAFMLKKYGYVLSKDEQLYLTIHIERIISKTER